MKSCLAMCSVTFVTEAQLMSPRAAFASLALICRHGSTALTTSETADVCRLCVCVVCLLD